MENRSIAIDGPAGAGKSTLCLLYTSTMASHLVYIKTRMLLSIHDEEAMSEMEQLIATLEAHQRNENYLKIKEIVTLLDQQFSYGRDFITKTPEAIQPCLLYTSRCV